MEFTWHASIGGVKYSQEHLRMDVIHRHHISTFIPSCYILPLYQWHFLCRPSSQWSVSVLPVPGRGCLPSQVLIIMDNTVASISTQRPFGLNLALTLHGSWMSHVATIEVYWSILPTHNTQHCRSVSRLSKGFHHQSAWEWWYSSHNCLPSVAFHSAIWQATLYKFFTWMDIRDKSKEFRMCSIYCVRLNRHNEQNVLVQIHYRVCKLTINQYLITGFMLRDNSTGGHCFLMKCAALPEQPCMVASPSMK